MAAVPDGIDVAGTLAKILPGAVSALGSGKSANQASSNSSVAVNTAVNPAIVVGGSGPVSTSGSPTGSASGSTGPQSASIPDYLPGYAPSYGQAGFKQGVYPTATGLSYSPPGDNSSLFLLALAGSGLLLLLSMGKKGAK